MPSGSPGLAQRIAPWLLAITLAMALLQAYRMNPVEEFRIGIEHRDAIPPCRTNPIQIFDAATPAVLGEGPWYLDRGIDRSAAPQKSGDGVDCAV